MYMNDEEKLFKEIESGKFREFYLVYNRKSTDEPDNKRTPFHIKDLKISVLQNQKNTLAPVTLKSFWQKCYFRKTFRL